MAAAAERMEHVAECRPEICTLDCGTMNFAEADYVMTNTPGMLREMAAMMRSSAFALKSKRSIPGICGLPKQLVEEGMYQVPVLVQLCMGIPWGAPDDLTPSWRW